MESDGGVTFIGAYLYDADGHATWLVAGGPNGDPYNFTGDLYSMSKGQTLFGSYVAPVGPNKAGTISVHFTDDTHGTVTWPGGTVPIQRHIFGGSDAAFQPAPGWWWNADESGSGYSIEVQGDKLFFVGFMYDVSGRPVWYFSAGTMNSLTTYSGSLLEFSGGQTLTGPYRPPGTPAPVGTVSIDFFAWDVATLRFDAPGAAAAESSKAVLRPKATTSRDEWLRPQFKKYAVPGPAKYASKFLIHQTPPGDLPKWTISGDLIWERYECGGVENSLCYYPSTGTVVVTVNGDTLGGICHVSGVRTYTRTTPAAAFLGIDGANWQMSIDWGNKNVPATTTCTIAGQSVTQTKDASWGWSHEAKNRLMQNQVPAPRSYVDGEFEKFENVSGGFFETYGVTLNGADLIETGYIIFFPVGQAWHY